MAAIRAVSPELAVEIEPSVPEPLQAHPLRAHSRDPRNVMPRRAIWPSICGVSSRAAPSSTTGAYRDALARRLRPHLEQIAEWLRCVSFYPHRPNACARPTARLEARRTIGSSAAVSSPSRRSRSTSGPSCSRREPPLPHDLLATRSAA